MERSKGVTIKMTVLSLDPTEKTTINCGKINKSYEQGLKTGGIFLFLCRIVHCSFYNFRIIYALSRGNKKPQPNKTPNTF